MSALKGSKNLLFKAHPIIIIEIHNKEIKSITFNLSQEIGYKNFDPLDVSSIEVAKELMI